MLLKKDLIFWLAVVLIVAMVGTSYAYTDLNVPDLSGADMDDSVSCIAGVQADAADLDCLFTSRDLATTIYSNQYDDSGATWGTTASEIVMANSTVQLGDHLYQSTTPFYAPATNTYYKWVMYFLSRPDTCDGIIEGGFVYMSFSNDFATWTTPVPVLGDATSSVRAWDCAAGNQGIAASGLGTFFHNGTIYMVISEGDVTALRFSSPDPAVTNLRMLSTTPAKATYVKRASNLMTNRTGGDPRGSYANISGIFNPNVSPFVLPSMFRRIGVSYDSATGELWIARGYSYLYDVGEQIPCGQVGCNYGVQLQTAREQLYTINIGNPINPDLFHHGSATFKADWGSASSYGMERGGACEHPGLKPGQTDLNSSDADYAFGSFLRNADGTLHANRLSYLATIPDQDRTGAAEGCDDTPNNTDIFSHALP